MADQNRQERLRPEAASLYLAQTWAIRASIGTLAKWRSWGEPFTPRFFIAGRDVSYSRADLDEFARAKLSKTSFGSTAESRQATAA